MSRTCLAPAVFCLLISFAARAQVPALEPAQLQPGAMMELPATTTSTPPSDAPVAEPTPTASPVTTPPPSNAIHLADRPAPPWWLQASTGFVAGAVTIPLTLYFAGWLGTVSNNVYVALVPNLLLMGLLPSLAVTAAIVGLGNLISPGRYPFWRVWGVTTLINIVALVIGTATGVSIGVFGRVALYALVDALGMSAGGTATARWLEKKDDAHFALTPGNPASPEVFFARTGQVSF